MILIGDIMMNFRVSGACLLMAMLLFSMLATATPQGSEPASEAPAEYANGWTHRPVLEHFTGLSCPPCMATAHPDATRLWEEEGYGMNNPWNYIEFHELNGGGEDDLMTDESRDRMRYYQPGVSGTPGLEADGGYVQMGGSHGSTADANYAEMVAALDDSGNRDAIKMANVMVGTIYDGNRFAIRVEVDYLENNEQFIPSPEQPLPDDTLRGLLHVFMVEDNVTAWSKTNDEYVTTHNVFREYGMEGREFELQPGDPTEVFYADWEVPTTAVRDGEEEDIRVPINPANIFPLAVIYDLDDTDSGRNDGSENNDGGDGDGTYRALNSATPGGTAFDLNNEPPMIHLKEPTSSGGKIQINAHIQDDGGELTGAFIIYRELQDNESQAPWSYKPLTIDGEECEGDVCTLESGEATVVLNIDDSKMVEYSINAYDGNWTKGSSQITLASVDTSDDNEFPTLVVLGVLAFMLIAGFVYWANQPARKTEDDILDAEQ